MTNCRKFETLSRSHHCNCQNNGIALITLYCQLVADNLAQEGTKASAVVVRYPKKYLCPDSKGHGANMGPTWGRQDPGGPYVGPMNLPILEDLTNWGLTTHRSVSYVKNDLWHLARSVPRHYHYQLCFIADCVDWELMPEKFVSTSFVIYQSILKIWIQHPRHQQPRLRLYYLRMILSAQKF